MNFKMQKKFENLMIKYHKMALKETVSYYVICAIMYYITIITIVTG